MPDFLLDHWQSIAATVHLAVGVFASGHVVLNKHDSRAAVAWVGMIWLTPLIGSMLYVVFGVNRIRRRAQSLRGPALSGRSVGVMDRSADEVCGVSPTLLPLIRLVGQVTGNPLLAGNLVVPLINGDEAYPTMVQAIDDAQTSVALSTYIFDNDRAGAMFLDALRRAAERKVAIRVLIDDVGSRYSWPPAGYLLRREGIPVTTFNPTFWPWRFRYSNLRNHRKALIIDGREAYTGGMNIREGCLLNTQPMSPVRDLHFLFQGPLVADIMSVFAVDWQFAAGEQLSGDQWFPPLEPQGHCLARGVPDGPDEDFDKLRLTLLGGISAAQRQVNIVTPYFLPDSSIISALKVAAMRGVTVNIVLPSENNLRMVQWASQALLPQIIESGCRVWYSQPPFDHSKLMVVDDQWVLVGSANWDPRSLDLNFEYVVECYDQPLARWANAFCEQLIRHSEQISLTSLRSRPLPVKLRDAIVGLGSPYL